MSPGRRQTQPRPHRGLHRGAPAGGHPLGLRPGEPPPQPLHALPVMEVLSEGGQCEQQEAVQIHTDPPPSVDDPYDSREEEQRKGEGWR